MSLKPGVLITLFTLALVGCGEQVVNNAPVAATAPAFKRVFTYSGQGVRPTFENDKSLKIEFVEVGPKTSSAHGEDGHGGGGTDDTYEGGKVGFADGSDKTFGSVTTGTSMNGTFSWVSSKN